MGNEPKRTDKRAFNNIMFGNDRGHITPKVAVDNFPFLPSLSIPMNIRRVTNGCDHTFLIKSHNWDDSVLFACSLRNTGWIDGSGGERGEELTGRRRRRSSPSYFLALCLPLLPAFYFLPLSGNKTKQPLGGKKVLLTSVVYVVFVADGFSPLGSVFLPISLSFSRSLTRATDGRTDSFSPILLTSVFEHTTTIIMSPPRRVARPSQKDICYCFQLLSTRLY